MRIGVMIRQVLVGTPSLGFSSMALACNFRLPLGARSMHSLWRYPVKSMMGEEISTAEVTPRGLYRAIGPMPCG
jgi:hypothetical protein